MRPLLIVASLVLVAGCATQPHTPAPAVASPEIACDEAFAVSAPAWTVEGFGGGDEQLIVSQRRPVKRCASPDAPTTVAAR